MNIPAGDNMDWLTIVVCIDTHGAYIPPYHIFKEKYMLQNHVELCGPGAAINVQDYGWITNEIICDWLEHFKSNDHRGVNKGISIFLF